MFYSLRLLLFLINIDQETLLNWFGLETSNFSSSSLLKINDDQLNILENNGVQSTSTLSINTFGLIIKGLIQRVQDGLTLADIENVIFFLIYDYKFLLHNLLLNRFLFRHGFLFRLANKSLPHLFLFCNLRLLCRNSGIYQVINF